MNQNIDSKIRMKLLNHDISLPEECGQRIDEIIRNLPDKENKKKHVQFRPAAAIAIVCLLISSITVFAAIDYARQRMESLSEEEKDSYYEGLQNSPADADSYSREFTDNENKRIEELRTKYENGTFPNQKLPVFKTQSEVDVSIQFYFVEDKSLFVLPSRELTDEEILEMIDFYFSRDYSLTEKVKEKINNVTVSPDKYIEKGGMDEQKAIEIAKIDVKNAYGIDCENFETSVEYKVFGDNDNMYFVTMTDLETKNNYRVSIDADQKLVTDILLNIKQGSNITDGIKVDQEKFTAKYEEALDILKKWKGTDLPIIQSTCEYNYNSDNCLEHGMVSYLFELEDGTGYEFYYSCANDTFFYIFMVDYDKNRQRIDQNEEKRRERGIVRKIIQMQ
jgi:hypothetical protein